MSTNTANIGATIICLVNAKCDDQKIDLKCDTLENRFKCNDLNKKVEWIQNMMWSGQEEQQKVMGLV